MLPSIKCCKGCVPPVRHSGCHSHCEKYLKEREEFDAQKDQIKAAKEERCSYGLYIGSRHNRAHVH